MNSNSVSPFGRICCLTFSPLANRLTAISSCDSIGSLFSSNHSFWPLMLIGFNVFSISNSNTWFPPPCGSQRILTSWGGIFWYPSGASSSSRTYKPLFIYPLCSYSPFSSVVNSIGLKFSSILWLNLNLTPAKGSFVTESTFFILNLTHLSPCPQPATPKSNSPSTIPVSPAWSGYKTPWSSEITFAVFSNWTLPSVSLPVYCVS